MAAGKCGDNVPASSLISSCTMDIAVVQSRHTSRARIWVCERNLNIMRKSIDQELCRHTTCSCMKLTNRSDVTDPGIIS